MFCIIGCTGQDLANLRHRLDVVEEEAADTDETVTVLAKKLHAIDRRGQENKTEIESLKKEVSNKIDISKFDSKLQTWAGGRNPIVRQEELRQFAQQSQGQLSSVEQQVNSVAGQVAGKMDRFFVCPIAASQTFANCTCLHVQDRQTGQWYCWRWNNANPQATTVLLTYVNQGGWCQWVIMAPSGVKSMQEALIPLPAHMKAVPPAREASEPPPPAPAPGLFDRIKSKFS